MSTTSSTSSSSSIASFYTSNGVTRLNGSELMSGLDTESLITALTAKTQGKIDTQTQQKQKAEWKQEMYREIQSLMVSLNSTYFSYSNATTNIMSSKFFDSGSLVSSSDAVSATGASSDAGNVIIDSITSLASAASVTSSYAPSRNDITSGALRSEWVQSSLSGKSLTVTYGGKDYALTLDSSASLDSDGTAEQNLQSIADALNRKIDADSGLSGNLQFSVAPITVDGTAGYGLSLSTTSSATASLSSVKTTPSDDSDAAAANTALLAALGLSSTESVANSDGTTTLIGTALAQVTYGADSHLFSHTVSSSSKLVLSAGTVTLGADIDLTGLTTDQAADKIAKQLQKQVDANAGLKSANVKISASGSDITITGATVTGGSQNLLVGLGLQNGDGMASGTVDSTKDLSASYLGDTLAGTTLTLELNGVSKTISFDSTDESDYSSVSGLQTYLHSKLDAAFGSGKVTVGDLTQDGKDHLTFATTDSTSILEITSSSASNILNKNGALRISADETNRLETTKTLNELAGELSNPLTAGTDGKYTISINKTSFSFSGDTELGTVISTINSSAAAGVTVTYSQTLNQFRIASDDTGSQGTIAIQDDKDGGNLAATLFGVDSSSIYTAASSLKAESGALTIDSGDNSTGTSDSVYTFTLSDGTSGKVTIGADQHYSDLAGLKSIVQAAVDADGSPLKGKVTVGVDTDNNRLTFSATPADTALTAAEDTESTNDVLGIGSYGQISTDAGQMTMAYLADMKAAGVVKNTGDIYYSVGDLTKLSGGTTLASIGYDGYAAGKDLVMTAELGGSGTATPVTRSTNSFTLDGVTLNITGKTDSPVTFTASSDVDDLYTKISDFVTAYNAIIDKVNTYTTDTPYGLGAANGTTESYEPLTDAQKKEMTDDEITEWNEKAKQGLLENDTTLNSILSDLRGAMERTVSSGLSLSSIGISIGGDWTSGGKLEIDETTLQNALKTEPDKVSDLFTSADGVAAKVKSVLTNYVGEYGNSGILYNIAGSSSTTTSSSDQLDEQISQYNDVITDLKSRLSDEQSYWQTKFSTMETKLSTLNSQYNYLSSMLGTSST